MTKSFQNGITRILDNEDIIPILYTVFCFIEIVSISFGFFFGFSHPFLGLIIFYIGIAVAIFLVLIIFLDVVGVRYHK
jgi:hypothetical protein